MRQGVLICLITWGLLIPGAFAEEGIATDPWIKMQERFRQSSQALSQPRETAMIDGKKGKAPQPVKKDFKNDPWVKLRTVFLPFSLEDEARAVRSKKYAASFSSKFYSVLTPYKKTIRRASALFNIPEEIISAVIMAESAGNPRAAAKTTTAKGLMQTIDSTFARARKGLLARRISITDDPFDPEASIMAGSWYLDRMFDRALADGRVINPDRHSIASWRFPLEYYYAGPGNGIKKANKIMVFSKGQHRVIDKQAYSGKIQTWAGILRIQGDKRI